MPQLKQKPHWTIPHVVGILVAIAVYIAIYAYTGDSDLFFAIVGGAASALAAWLYLFPDMWWKRK